MFLDPFAPYKLSNTQQMDSREGLAWSAILTLGKTKVLHVHDGGYGGALEIHPIDAAAYKAFEAHVAALPHAFFQDDLPSPFGEPSQPARSPHDRIEHFLSCLGDATQNDKRFRRVCRTQTLVRLKADPPGEFRVYKVIHSPAVAAKLRQKHGDALDFVLNERLAAPCAK
jgi:hypothetical protein